MTADNSSPTVMSGCDAMTGVCDASTNYAPPNRLLPVCKVNVWKINQQMQILEITGDLELCPTSGFRKTTKMMCHEYFVDDFEVQMTEPVDSVDLLVAKFNGLKLNEKREIKESKKEHFQDDNGKEMGFIRIVRRPSRHIDHTAVRSHGHTRKG